MQVSLSCGSVAVQLRARWSNGRPSAWPLALGLCAESAQQLTVTDHRPTRTGSVGNHVDQGFHLNRLRNLRLHLAEVATTTGSRGSTSGLWAAVWSPFLTPCGVDTVTIRLFPRGFKIPRLIPQRLHPPRARYGVRFCDWVRPADPTVLSCTASRGAGRLMADAALPDHRGSRGDTRLLLTTRPKFEES